MKEKIRNSSIVRRLLSIIAAVVMTLGMVGGNAIPAMAANLDTATSTGYTIKIKAPEGATGSETHTYTIYRVFTATQSGSNISYKLPSGATWPSVGTTGNETIANFFNKDAADNITEIYNGTVSQARIGGSGSNSEDLKPEAVKAIQKFVTDNSSALESATATTTGNAETTVNVPAGYYFITTSTGSVVMVDSTNPTATVNDKNTLPTVDKKQSKTTTASDFTDNKINVAVGDTINYTVDVTVPANANSEKDITVTDTMTAGLTFGGVDGVTATYKDGEGTDQTLEKTADNTTNWSIETPAQESSDSYTFKITLKPNDTVKGKTITFHYTATVNTNALKTDTTKKNTVELSYDNHTSTDNVEYGTSTTGVIKFDGVTGEEDQSNADTGLKAKSGQTLKFLENVEFQLKQGNTEVKVSKDSDGYYYPDANGTETIKSDSNGKIIIRGLDGTKTYTLEETKPLDGYNKLAGPVTLKLTDDTKAKVTIGQGSESDTTYLAGNTSYVAKIANNTGAQLPSTGGIGTTIFYVIGGVVVAGAVILLLARRRKNA